MAQRPKFQEILCTSSSTRNHLTQLIIALLIVTMVFSGVSATSAHAFSKSKATEGVAENAYEQIASLEDLIPADATEYLRADLDAIREVANETFDNVNITGSLSLGQPYVVCDITITTQDETYNYPIVDDKTGNIVLVAEVINTTEGWTYGISREMTNELNDLDYLENPCLFYSDGNNLVADDTTTKSVINGEETPVLETFSAEPLENKVAAVEIQIENMAETDIQAAAKRASEKELDGYSPGLTTTSTGKYCDLYYKRGQGSWNLCWAANVATIINYRKGTNYFATRIADKMDVDYNEGASYKTAQKALQTYSCTEYSYAKGKQLSWAKIKANIAKKKPVYASCTANSGGLGHSVTVYGYKKSNDVKYVKVWNSALNKGAGDTKVFEFKSSGTTIKSGNSTYTWARSVYAVDSTD